MSQTASYDVSIAGTTDGGDRVPDLSPREARERWLGKIRVSKSDSTVSTYHYRLKHFVEWCEEQGLTSIKDVTGWDLESFETSRREQGVTPITLNQEMGTLQNFLEYCARIELVAEELPDKIQPPDVPRDAEVDDTRLRTDDAKMLLGYYEDDPEECASRAHVLLSLAWYTGARLGGLRALDLSDYYSDDQYVRFVHRPRKDTPLKNGQDGERAVGLPEKVCDVVDEYIKLNRHEQYDDYGRAPLLASEVGRPSVNSVRVWMYLGTLPCLHSACPHGNDPDTCEYIDYAHASKCPSSRSPHQVRTGSITWQLNRGIPVERVAERVNTSIRILKRHYDKQSQFEEMKERRQEFVNRLNFDESGGDEE